MNFSSICRTCLSNENLNPIFKSDDNHERWYRAIYLSTGVQIKFNDSLPQNICTTCLVQLNNILQFRKQCKESEKELLKIKTELESSASSIVSNKDITLTIPKYNNVKRNQLLTANGSNIQNGPCLMKIRTEFSNSIDVKPNLQDIDDNDTLNYLIQSLPQDNGNSIALLQENNLKTIPSNNTSAGKESTPEPSNINIDFFNEESNLYDNEEDFKKEETFLFDFVTHCGDITDTKPFKCLINSGHLQNNHKTKIKPKSLKSNNSKKFNDTEAGYYENYMDSKSSHDLDKSVEVPYEVITDSDTKKSTRVMCKLCQKELSIRSIDSHMARRHPGADERKVKCELCDKYVMRDKLNRHKMMMHGSAGFRCGYCKSEFDSKEMLVEHVATCTAKKRKRKINETGRELAECDICNKTMQKASLKMHKAVKHAGLRPVCEHCGKSFGNKFRLNEHYRAKHGYEKFQCSYCDFRSAGIMAMRNHERRHRGEKPFVCETCGAKFHAQYLLTQHKHSHRTEKLVKCDLCPASFKANNSLHMHKLTCHSKSVYRCTICSRSYKCRYYAVKHVRLAHSHSGAPPLIKLMTH